VLLENLNNVNTAYSTVVKSTVAEYDIKAAGATAIKHIMGTKIYDELMSMSKHDRVVKIGLMMRDDPTLSKKVDALMLSWLNMFIEKNKIKMSNVLSTTRDSIIIHKKIPTKLIFDDVEFRNKDGIFSSMYRMGRLTLYFDSMRGEVVVKGLTSNFDVSQSPLFHTFITKYLYQFESLLGKTDNDIFHVLKDVRYHYLHSPDVSIYRDVLNKNKIGIRFKDRLDNIVYLEDDSTIIDDSEDYFIAKDCNYVNVIMPVMRAVQFIS